MQHPPPGTTSMPDDLNRRPDIADAHTPDGRTLTHVEGKRYPADSLTEIHSTQLGRKVIHQITERGFPTPPICDHGVVGCVLSHGKGAHPETLHSTRTDAEKLPVTGLTAEQEACLAVSLASVNAFGADSRRVYSTHDAPRLIKALQDLGFDVVRKAK